MAAAVATGYGHAITMPAPDWDIALMMLTPALGYLGFPHCGLISDADAGLEPRMEEGSAKRMSRAPLCRRDLHGVTAARELTAPRPKGRGFPLHGAEPKPLYAIQDLQALRGLTLPARQLLYYGLR